MRTFLRLQRIHVAIGLLVLVLSIVAFWLLKYSQDAESPILTREKAVQVALEHLTKNNIAVDILSTDVLFMRGNWYVMFFVNPARRPASILITVNPISGEAKTVPLK